MVIYSVGSRNIFQNEVDDCRGGGVYDVSMVSIYARETGNGDYRNVSFETTISERHENIENSARFASESEGCMEQSKKEKK